MSAWGHSRRLGHVGDKSGLPQTADISGSGRHFAFVPIPDSCTAANSISFDYLVSTYRPWPTGLEGRAGHQNYSPVASNERLSGRTLDQSESGGWAASGGATFLSTVVIAGNVV